MKRKHWTSENNGHQTDLPKEPHHYENIDCKPAVLLCYVANSPTAKYGLKINALPDSGCEISTISFDIAEHLNVHVLRTPKRAFSASGEEVALCGQSTVYVRVQGVGVKKLKVLVEQGTREEFTIGYMDLITLRVLAPNFPNKLDATAPLLQHPLDNLKTTPLLQCNLHYYEGEHHRVITVAAVPDTGCSGKTVLSTSFARKIGIHLKPTTLRMKGAGGHKFKASGEANCALTVAGTPRHKIIYRRVVVLDITDSVLLSWYDLIHLGVLNKNFPSPTPE